MNRKTLLCLSFLILISSLSYGAAICTQYETICTHEIDGICQTYDYDKCSKYVEQESEYSSGCDISSLTKNINQNKCELVATCSDTNSVRGTCERGTGCYPGYYFDNCPSGYDYRSLATTRTTDCTPYGQAGTLTLEKYEYGYLQSGNTMTTSGGSVTCQKFYSPRQKESCGLRLQNGERPSECYVNECATLAANPRCTRVSDLGTTNYGNEATILNTDCVWVVDPVNGNVCTTDPNQIASLTDDRRLYDVSVEKYECESQDIRTCKEKDYKIVCADGTSQLCNEIKECTEWATNTYVYKVEKSWQVKRDSYQEKCVKGSSECTSLKNNANCIFVAETQEEVTENIRFINGFDANGSSKNCFISYNSKCREISMDQVSWSSCVTSFNNNVTASVSSLFPKPVVNVENLMRPDGRTNLSGCFGAGDDAYDQFVYADVTYVDIFENYQCYTDYSVAPVESGCTQSGDDLCINYVFDSNNSSKAVCTKKETYYLCPLTKTETTCSAFSSAIECSDQQYSLPNISLENDNTTTDFGKSLALLGILDDINSIWSGKYGKCSYGWLKVGTYSDTAVTTYVIGEDTRVYCNNCKGSGTFCFLLGTENGILDEKKSYEMSKKGLCHYLGTECTDRLNLIIGSICLVNTRKYCCYDSKLARVLVEQSYLQLGKDWNAGCNGLTIDDLNSLDFSTMDLSEIEDELANKINLQDSTITNQMQQTIGNFYQDFSDAAKQNGTTIDGAN